MLAISLGHFIFDIDRNVWRLWLQAVGLVP